MATKAEIKQRDKALRKANRLRIRAAKVKRDLRDGKVKIGAVLRKPTPEYLRFVKVYDLLSAQYRWGPTRTNTLLRRASITGTRQLGQLTQRQREMLARFCDWEWEKIENGRAKREAENNDG